MEITVEEIRKNIEIKLKKIENKIKDKEYANTLNSDEYDKFLLLCEILDDTNLG